MSRQLGIRKIVGRRIAQKRDQVGLTQEQVAERIALSREAYARYERGTADVSLGKLIKIAAVFKCSVEELIVETSTGATAQAQHIANLLEHLTTQDRDEVVSIVERICMLAHHKYQKNPTQKS